MSEADVLAYLVDEVKSTKDLHEKHLDKVDKMLATTTASIEKKQNTFYTIAAICAMIVSGMFGFSVVKNIEAAAIMSKHTTEIEDLQQSSDVTVNTFNSSVDLLTADLEKERNILQKQINQLLEKHQMITRGTVVK